MKKLSGSRTVRILKRIFNIQDWADWYRIKTFFYTIIHSVKILTIPRRAKKSSDRFEDVVVRLSLTDDALAIKRNYLWRWSILMLCFSLLLFLYSIYQFIYGSFLSGVVSISLMGISLALSFRYHFWFYQINNRRLGCSFYEWFIHGCLGKKYDK